jgi:hypothetical protein
MIAFKLFGYGPELRISTTSGYIIWNFGDHPMASYYIFHWFRMPSHWLTGPLWGMSIFNLEYKYYRNKNQETL